MSFKSQEEPNLLALLYIVTHTQFASEGYVHVTVHPLQLLDVAYVETSLTDGGGVAGFAYAIETVVYTFQGVSGGSSSGPEARSLTVMRCICSKRAKLSRKDSSCLKDLL